MAAQGSFYYESEYSEVDSPEVLDSFGNKVTTIKCHGRLVFENKGQLEEMFKHIPFQGRIVIDLSDVDYIDSAGLGALVRLKVSAKKEAGVSLKFVQMTRRVMQLLCVTQLREWFSS